MKKQYILLSLVCALQTTHMVCMKLKKKRRKAYVILQNITFKPSDIIVEKKITHKTQTQAKKSQEKKIDQRFYSDIKEDSISSCSETTRTSDLFSPDIQESISDFSSMASEDYFADCSSEYSPTRNKKKESNK